MPFVTEIIEVIQSNKQNLFRRDKEINNGFEDFPKRNSRIGRRNPEKFPVNPGDYRKACRINLAVDFDGNDTWSMDLNFSEYLHNCTGLSGAWRADKQTVQRTHAAQGWPERKPERVQL